MASPPTGSAASGPGPERRISSSKVRRRARPGSPRAAPRARSVTTTLARQSSRMKRRVAPGRRVLRGTATAPSLSAPKKVAAKATLSGMRRATRCSPSTPSARKATAARPIRGDEGGARGEPLAERLLHEDGYGVVDGEIRHERRQSKPAGAAGVKAAWGAWGSRSRCWTTATVSASLAAAGIQTIRPGGPPHAHYRRRALRREQALLDRNGRARPAQPRRGTRADPRRRRVPQRSALPEGRGEHRPA